jgi:hypothetical protein
MVDKQVREKTAKYLDEYYGFPSNLEGELQRNKNAIDAKDLIKLDKYVDKCIANREEPDLKIQPIMIRSADEVTKKVPSLEDAKSRYVLYQLIKKVTALRLAAISEAARPDSTIDLDILVKALSTREKGVTAETPKELKDLLGSKPTADVAAQVLVGLHVNPIQQIGAKGFWDYVCRNRCCFWGWRCSWGCLIIGCWA